MERRPRAQRFPIQTSLRFREHGESAWRTGATINVSRSGVLFRADGPLPDPVHAVDFIIELPLNGVTPGPHVRCTGHVVRTAPEEIAGGGCAMAVTIDGYGLEGRLGV
jgi:hypothetical protein